MPVLQQLILFYFKLGQHDFNLLCPDWCLNHLIISHKIPREPPLLDTCLAATVICLWSFLMIAFSKADPYLLLPHTATIAVVALLKMTVYCHVHEDWYKFISGISSGWEGDAQTTGESIPSPRSLPPPLFRKINLKNTIAKLQINLYLFK